MSDDPAPAPDAGQGNPTPAPAAAPETAVGWSDGFQNADLKGYVETKGFADAEALANSYQNLEKLRGVPADQLLQLPKDMTNREEMSPIYAKLGMPETVDGYQRVLPDTFDTGVYDSLANQAHQLGLGDGQFQGLQQTFSEQAEAMIQQQEDTAVAEFDAWKSGNSEGFTAAARVMSEVGMTETELEGVLNGDKASLYDFLAKVGGRTSESTIVQGDDPGGSAFSMSPSAAKTKIAELMGDDAFMKNYTSPSKDVRMAAIARMEELQKLASA